MPEPITDPKANTTVVVETETLETTMDVPAEVTVKADVGALVALKVSLKVRVNDVPAALTAAELNVGEVVSFTTVELLVIVCAEKEETSFP